MASPERREEALVLKKTKLGEADLILHLMASDGSALRVVAKGARKPNNASSATLDAFNHVSLTIVCGKGLGIAKGSKLISRQAALHADPALFATSSVIAEIADAVIEPDLPVGRLFDMTCAALDAAGTAHEDALPLLVAAYAFKVMALLGMRPSFRKCACCEDPVRSSGGSIRFSHEDGGVLCEACARTAETVRIPSQTADLCDALLRSTFADIGNGGMQGDAWDAAHLAQVWIARHIGCRLRSFAAFKSICGCMQAASVV